MVKPFDQIIAETRISPYIKLPETSLTTDTTGKVRPLDARGHIVRTPLTRVPAEMTKDFIKDIKNVGRGLKGDLNDHELGRINDVGMKLGGLLIAIYLATKKSNYQMQKVMEFAGFGAFFASMALWPKIMIQKPIEWMYGVDIGTKYVDSFGRKKSFHQDPQYKPWSLYSHTEKQEMADKMGIPKSLPNRIDIMEEESTKKAVQGNTLWMLTAGFATPLMTALFCNLFGQYMAPLVEAVSKRRANKEIANPEKYAAKYRTEEIKKQIEKFVKRNGDKEINSSMREVIASILCPDTTLKAKEAILKDLEKIFAPQERPLSIEVDKFVDELMKTEVASRGKSTTVGGALKKAGANSDQVGNFLTKFRNAMFDGIEESTMHDFFADKNQVFNRMRAFAQRENANLDDLIKLLDDNYKKLAEVQGIPKEDFSEMFFRCTEPDKIKSIVKNIGVNDKLSENVATTLKNAIKAKSINLLTAGERGTIPVVYDVIDEVVKSHLGETADARDLALFFKEALDTKCEKAYVPLLTKDAAQKLRVFAGVFSDTDAAMGPLNKHFSIMVGERAESVVANRWERVMQGKLLKGMGFTSKEINTIAAAYPLNFPDDAAHQIIDQRLEAICKDPKKLGNLISSMAGEISAYDKIFDSNMTLQTNAAYEKTYNKIGANLRANGFGETADFFAGSQSQNAIHEFRLKLYEALGISKDAYESGKFHDLEAVEAMMRSRFSEIGGQKAVPGKNAHEIFSEVTENLKILMKINEKLPLADAIREAKLEPQYGPNRVRMPIGEYAIRELQLQNLFNEYLKPNAENNNQVEAIFKHQMSQQHIDEILALLEKGFTVKDKNGKIIREVFEEIKAGNLNADSREARQILLGNAEFMQKDNLAAFFDKLFDNKCVQVRFNSNEIPEKIPAYIPEEAAHLYNDLVKIIRKTLLSPWDTTMKNLTDAHDYDFNLIKQMLATDNELSSAFKNLSKWQLTYRTAGARSCFYRTIQMLDVERRIQSGVLEKQCKEVYKEMFGKEMKDVFSGKALAAEIEKIKHSCRTVTAQDVAGFTTKFDNFVSNRYNNEAYSFIMRLLYGSDIDSTTMTALGGEKSDLFKGIKTYFAAVREHVCNARNKMNPATLADPALKNPVADRPMVKSLLMGKDRYDIFIGEISKRRNSNKWFAIFGTMFAGLLGATLLAEACFGKIDIKKYQVQKGDKNDKFSHAV